MTQPKVLPTGVRVFIGIILGLLGFVFPLLFVPAALILWSVFEDQKVPPIQPEPPVNEARPKHSHYQQVASPANAGTGADPLSNQVSPKPATRPPAIRRGASERLSSELKIFGTDFRSVSSSPLSSTEITPAAFLRQFGFSSFYHFTDTRNLASIRAHGGLLPWSQVKGKVPAPGGNDWSHDADALKGQDDYIHLCFFPEHPMEFVAKREGRILESRFLRIDPSIVHKPGILFCPDVGNKAGVPMLCLADASSQMDFEIIGLAHKRWLEPPLFERKRVAMKYELLVPGKIPLSLISGL